MTDHEKNFIILGKGYVSLLYLRTQYEIAEKEPPDDLMTIKPGPLEPFDRPLTVLWSYCVSAGGIEAVHPASCGRLLFRSNC